MIGHYQALPSPGEGLKRRRSAIVVEVKLRRVDETVAKVQDIAKRRHKDGHHLAAVLADEALVLSSMVLALVADSYS